MLATAGIVGGSFHAVLGLVAKSFVQSAPGLASLAIAISAIALIKGREYMAGVCAGLACSVVAPALLIDPSVILVANLLVALACLVGRISPGAKILSVFLSAIAAAYAVAFGALILMGITGQPAIQAVGFFGIAAGYLGVLLAQIPSLAATPRVNTFPALCLVSTLTLTLVLAYETRQGGYREAHQSAKQNGSFLVSSLNRGLEIRQLVVKHVAELWEIGEPSNEQFWGTQANSLMRYFSGLTTLERVDETGRVSWLFPHNPPPHVQEQLNTDPFRQKIIAERCAAGTPGLGPTFVMANGHQGALFVVPVTRNGRPDGAILGLIDLVAITDMVLGRVGTRNHSVTVSFGSELIRRTSEKGTPAIARSRIETPQFGVEVAQTKKSLPATATVLPLAIMIVGFVMGLKLALIVRFALLARKSMGELRQANCQVVEEREQLRSAIDVARLGVWRLSVTDDVATLDPRSAEIFGYKAEGDSLQISLLDRLVDDPSKLENLHAKLGSGESISDEVRVRTADGSSKLIGLYGHATIDEDGSVIGFTGVMADLDEQRATECQLAQSNAKFKAMLESAPLGIFLTEPDGACIYTNPAYDQISDLPPAASRGYSCLLGIHSDDRGRVASEWAVAIESRCPLSTTLRFSWIDGTIRDCAVQASPVWVGTEIIGYIGFLQDITERLQAQEELKRARDRVEALLNSTNAVVYSLKPFGTFNLSYVTPNIAEIFGLEPANMLMTSEYLVGRVHPDYRDRFVSFNDLVIRNGTWTEEYRILDGSEAFRWIRDSRNLIFDMDGRPIEIAGYWIDITPQRLAEEGLREKSAINEAMLETANYGIMTTLPDGTISTINPAVCSILGYEPYALLGKRTLDSLYLKEELQICAEQASRVLDKPFEADFRALTAMVENGVNDVDNWTLIGADGKLVPVTVSLSRIALESGALFGYMAILQDDTERRLYQTQIDHQLTQLSEARLLLEEQQFELHSKNLELERLATTDGLTGLLNRRAVMEQLRQSVALADRHGHAVSVLMMDVDHFKAYNDSFGHPAGDDVLRHVAEIIREAVRSTDICGRYGGEEFVVILPETAEAGGFLLAERIRAAIEQFNWPNRQVTVSIGISTRTSTDSDETLLMRADEALYESKGAGRNRVTASTPKAA